MKIIGFGLGLVLLSSLPLAAQVTIEVRPEQEQYLAGEKLDVAVRITNLSGQTLHLGADNKWLQLGVESRDSYIVQQLGEVPVAGEFDLPSSKVAIKHLNLQPYFNLTRPANYTISATVHIAQWGQDFGSAPASFNIINGAKIWEREFGVPKADGSPEVRKYALLQANYLRELMLYVRVTDSDGVKIFGVQAIGPLVSFSEPDAQLDEVNNLHVLWQISARGSAYRVISPDCKVLVRQTYLNTDTRVQLHKLADGQIVVTGGQRYSAPDDLDLRTPPPPLPPPQTNAPAALLKP